jgi:hypothetical protein
MRFYSPSDHHNPKSRKRGERCRKNEPLAPLKWKSLALCSRRVGCARVIISGSWDQISGWLTLRRAIALRWVVAHSEMGVQMPAEIRNCLLARGTRAGAHLICGALALLVPPRFCAAVPATTAAIDSARPHRRELKAKREEKRRRKSMWQATSWYSEKTLLGMLWRVHTAFDPAFGEDEPTRSVTDQHEGKQRARLGPASRRPRRH